MSEWDVVEHTPIEGAAAGTPPDANKSDRVRPVYITGGEKDWEVAEEKPTEPDKTTFGERLGHGFMNPIEGGGQLVAGIIPRQIERKVDEFNNFLSEQTGGAIRKLPEGGKNEQIRQREEEYQAKRGSSAGNLDPAAIAGDMLNPVNYIGLGAASKIISGANTISKVARPIAESIFGGATGGAMQPAASKHPGEEKIEQIGIGGFVGGIIGTAGTAVSAGLHGLGSWQARNYQENLQSDAIAKVLKRIKSDEKAGGPSAADAIDLVQQAKKPWGPNPDAKPVSMVDVTGKNVEGLAGNIARAPGDSRAMAEQFFEKRDKQAEERLQTDIWRYVSGGPTMFQANEALLAARSSASRPIYEQVNKLQNVWSPRLGEFFEHPDIQKGLSRGYQLESRESLAEGRPITATQMGVDIAVDGSTKILGVPNMRLLNMAKKGLDAAVADARDPVTGRLSEEGVSIDKLRRAYVEAIDQADSSGLYKKARETWQGFSESLDALRVGKTALDPSRSPEENAAIMKTYSPANQEFIRMGLADTLRTRLMKSGFSGDEAKQLMKNPWMREQMRPFFKNSADADAFIDAVTVERTMFNKRNTIMKGSQTAEREAEDAFSAGEMLAAGKVAKDVVTGNFMKAAGDSYKMWKDLGMKPNQELNAKVAEILFSTRLPDDIAKAIKSGKAPEKINKLRGAANMTRENVNPGLATGMGTGAAAAATEGER